MYITAWRAISGAGTGRSDTCQSCRRHTVHPSSNYGRFGGTRFLYFLSSFGARAPSGTGPPHSRGFLMTHHDAPQSIGLFWTSDQLVAETSTWLTPNTYNRQTSMRRWDSNPQSQQTSDCRPTPYTARPLGPAVLYFQCWRISNQRTYGNIHSQSTNYL